VRNVIILILCKIEKNNRSNDEFNDDGNNSIQFFIIYVPCQQPQGQLQTEHSVDSSNYIMDNYNIK
jgi:hypothetical protein